MMFMQLKIDPGHALAFGLMAASTGVLAGPCDIYAGGGTPCAAAHSTTRALYDNYKGSLYQVQRTDNSATRDIKPRKAGGVASAQAQDDFCDGTTCLISIIYDQSGHGNHLTQAPPGGIASGPEPGGYDSLAAADGAPVTLNGHKAYGVFISPGTGYRNNQPSGTAINDEPEGIYAVLDGSHYGVGCCFDYGNAETSSQDTGNGHMEALYFGAGDGSGHGTGSGPGPWIMADMENGLFSGPDSIHNANGPTISDRFLTAIIKGKPNHWAIRGGNAAGGGLSTFYNGKRPNAPGYNPMSKEGAIVLGIGGDNSIHGQGTFYEGVMTSGYPDDATEDSVQENIVAAGYATTPLTSGKHLRVGSSISLRVTSACCRTRYLAHTGPNVNTQELTASSGDAIRKQASWKVRAGLGNRQCFSFESVDTPGSFIRHANYVLQLNPDDGTQLFSEDATFCPQEGFGGIGTSFRSWSYPTRYWRHYESVGYVANNGGPEVFDTQISWTEDVTWDVINGLALGD